MKRYYLALLLGLLFTGCSLPELQTNSALSYHFNKILTVKSFVEKGDTLDKAVFKLVPKIIFFRESSFKRQVSIWTRERILSVLELLFKAEKDCKTTNMPVEEIVSYTIMQIASAAAKLAKIA